MFFSALLSLCVNAPAQPAKAFEFKDGDRVVWIGSTLVEREQRYGYWETALLAANADKNITFRNLGWSGDTVFGESRGRFDFANPDKCFRQLVDQTLELKPTVIFISYGTNESFAGKEGLPRFEKGLEKLLDALKPAKARILLFTPLPPIELVNTRPEASRAKMLSEYAEAIRKIAAKQHLYLADANEQFKGPLLLWREAINNPVPTSPDFGRSKFSINGMHLTEEGYQRTSDLFLRSLGLSPRESGSATLEPLRKAIIKKNQLFFHRWRPENETYLFGFRKHEQGKNAKEVAEFDPLVAKAEKEIAKLLKELDK